MRYLFLAVLILTVLVGVNSTAYAQQSPTSGSKSVDTVSETAEPNMPNTGEEQPGSAVPMPPEPEDNLPVSTPPEPSGEERWQSYDENTGLPDATESDRRGEVE